MNIRRKAYLALGKMLFGQRSVSELLAEYSNVCESVILNLENYRLSDEELENIKNKLPADYDNHDLEKVATPILNSRIAEEYGLINSAYREMLLDISFLSDEEFEQFLSMKSSVLDAFYSVAKLCIRDTIDDIVDKIGSSSEDLAEDVGSANEYYIYTLEDFDEVTH